MSNFSLDEMVPLLKREARSRRSTLLIMFAIISLLFLTVGFFWPKTYTSSAKLYVDDSNIIDLMLDTKTATQRDKVTVAKEILTSHEILNQIIDAGKLVAPGASAVERERVKKELLKKIEVKDLNNTLLLVSFKDEDPNIAYKNAVLLSNLFLERTANSQSEESLEAFSFIEEQVHAKRAELEDAERRLEAFRAQYPGIRPGADGNIDQRIFELRRQLESNELQYIETRQRRITLQRELSSESSTLNTDIQGSYYSEQIAALQAQIEQLRLNYTDDYPDIVRLKKQVQDYNQMMRSSRERTQNTAPSSQTITFGENSYSTAGSVNPVYQQLRADLARSKAEENSLQQRIQQTRRLLEEGLERASEATRVERQLTELTRDYTINMELYEQLVKQRENARLTMTLGQEKKDVLYRIEEVPNVPILPSGLRFAHIAALGLILGALLPFAFLFAFLKLDPRIRTPSIVTEELDLPLLAVIPHMQLADEKAGFLDRPRSVLIVILAVLVIYAIVGWIKFTLGAS